MKSAHPVNSLRSFRSRSTSREWQAVRSVDRTHAWRHAKALDPGTRHADRVSRPCLERCDIIVCVEVTLPGMHTVCPRNASILNKTIAAEMVVLVHRGRTAQLDPVALAISCASDDPPRRCGLWPPLSSERECEACLSRIAAPLAVLPNRPGMTLQPRHRSSYPGQEKEGKHGHTDL
jgi:hypothetical protein